jgi:hypothetical protein
MTTKRKMSEMISEMAAGFLDVGDGGGEAEEEVVSWKDRQ